jgi:outer membrane protein insertion porin family
VSEEKLKSELKGTKEKSHVTLFPSKDETIFNDTLKYNFHDYMHEWGFLSYTKTRELLEPYIKIKPFSSAKFDLKKYTEDKEKVLSYYNSLGYRDAAIVQDTQYVVAKSNNMHIEIKLDEGHKYYFGNISWSGATKYSDSLLAALLGIKKGDIYNRDILDKKLGITISPEGGDISWLIYGRWVPLLPR